MAGSILIVDDEASVTMTLEWFFRNKGYRVFRAFYGDQALERIEKDRPSVVILDLQMPGVDGISVLDQLRQRYPEVKVLVITGYAKQYQKELDRLKPEAVKLKPVSLEELTVSVEELLGGKPAEAGPAALAPERVRLLFVEGSEELYHRYLKPYFESPERRPMYEVALACAPDAAITLLKEFKPHLVLLDGTRMPIGVDAGRLAADLARDPDRPREVVLHAITFPLHRAEGFSTEQLKTLEVAVQRVAQRHHLLPVSS